jgi:hypothetical protein
MDIDLDVRAKIYQISRRKKYDLELEKNFIDGTEETNHKRKMLIN